MKSIFQNVFFKMGVILALILILLIPTSMVQGLIQERMERQQEAVDEVSSKHASAQSIQGPILTIPYKDVAIDTSASSRNSSVKYFHLLPEHLDIDGTVNPERRKRGIFDVIVYSSGLNLKGDFSFDQLALQGIQANQLLLKDAFLTVGISDLKGVREQVDIELDGKNYKCDPGVLSRDVVQSGIHSRVSLDSLQEKLPFEFNLSVNGSEDLSFIPVGKVTNVTLKSPWKDPSFDGSFLPVQRSISQDGFKAHWKVLHINRNYPQGWKGNKYSIQGADFGVKLQLPVDVYQKSTRVAKYAVLFILLTFLVFFFVEVLNGILIHPIQYILVGLALVLFYILLLAFSEQMTFNTAYLIAAGMTLVLIFLYSRSVLKSWGLSAVTVSIQTITYGFIFILIQIQDYALLFGSLGVFLILAVTMYFSRKIEWFDLVKRPEIPEEIEGN